MDGWTRRGKHKLRNTRRLTAVFLAFMMLFASMMPAMAVDSGGTGPLIQVETSVGGASGDVSGDAAPAAGTALGTDDQSGTAADPAAADADASTDGTDAAAPADASPAAEPEAAADGQSDADAQAAQAAAADLQQISPVITLDVSASLKASAAGLMVGSFVIGGIPEEISLAGLSASDFTVEADGTDGCVTGLVTTDGAITLSIEDVPFTADDIVVDYVGSGAIDYGFTKADIVDTTVEASFEVVSETFEYGEDVVAVVLDLGAAVNADDLSADGFAVSTTNTHPTKGTVVYEGARAVEGLYVNDTGDLEDKDGAGRYVVLELQHGYGVTGAGTLVFDLSTWRNELMNLNYEVDITAPVQYADGLSVEADGMDLALAGQWNALVDRFAADTQDGVNYRLFTPADADGAQPLVIWFHGAGERGVNNESQIRANMGGVAWAADDRQASQAAYVLAAQASGGWTAKEFKVVYDTAMKMVADGLVDADRIYVAGCSMGGGGTLNFLIAYPDLAAAAIPICPAITLTAEQAAVISDIPLWIVQAANDTTVTPVRTRANVAVLEAAGADVYYTEIPDVGTYPGHWSWIPVLNNMTDPGAETRGPIMDWLFDQTKSDVPVLDGFLRAQSLGGVQGFLYTPEDWVCGSVTAPFIVVYGEEDFTLATAAQYLKNNGIDDLAMQDGAQVMLLSAIGDDYGDADVAAYLTLMKLVSDSSSKAWTDGVSADGFYAGSPERAYVIAEGEAADFVVTSIVGNTTLASTKLMGSYSRIMGATSVILKGTDAVPASTVEIEVPAALIDCGADTAAWFKANNGATEDQGGGLTVNPVNGCMKTYEADCGEGDIAAAYAQICDMRRYFMDIEDGKAVTRLYSIPDYDAEGISETVFNYDGYDVYEYRGDDLDTTVAGSVPLMLIFHGGGNHARFLAWATQWPEVARDNGFVVLSVQNHYAAGPDVIMAMVDAYIAAHPEIDATRIYASGFSMGSATTQNLMVKYGKRFAGFVPMDGSFGLTYTDAATNPVVPTLYLAGRNDPLTVFPHQTGTLNGPDRMIDFLFKSNNIDAAGYTYDAAAGNVYGVTFDEVETIDVADRNYANTLTIGYLDSADGNCYTALQVTDRMMHTTIPCNTQPAWNFISRFSRQADGSIDIAGVTRDFNIVTEVFEYGQDVTAVVIDMNEAVDGSTLTNDTFSVSTVNVNPVTGATVYSGGRTVTGAYVSDTGTIGDKADTGRYVVLELEHGFGLAGASTLIYYGGMNRVMDMQVAVAQNAPLTLVSGDKAGAGSAYHKAGETNLIVDDFARLTRDGLNYRLYSPAETDEALPVVIWLHGAGERGTTNEAQIRGNMGGVAWASPENQAKHPSYVLAPQSTMGWNATELATVRAIVLDLIAAGKVDANRVYLSGCSMGGGGTIRFLAAYPELFAASIPICPFGTLTDAQVASMINIPIWFAHATNDPVIRVAGTRNLTAQFQRLGLDVYFTEFPDVGVYNGHWSWIPVLNNYVDEGPQQRGDMFDWLYAQAKGGTVYGTPRVGIQTQETLNLDLDQTIDYGIVAGNVKAASIIRVSGTYDESLVRIDSFETKIPGAFAETTAAGGAFTATILIPGAGFTQADLAEVMTVHCTILGKGTATTALSTADISSVSYNAKAAYLSPASMTTTVVDYRDLFDLNADGYINLSDLSRILVSWYGAMSGDAVWTDAAKADYTGDGLIDAADVLILLHYIQG